MILRRITEHVKAQNWLAVGLDFLIVVVGILLAFWINAWSAEQSDRAALHSSLESLYSELETNIELLDVHSRRHEDIIAAGQTLLTLADNPETVSAPTDILGKVFISGWTTDYSTGALTSLTSSQRFDFIDDPNLKLAIAGLPAAYSDAIEDEVFIINLLDALWNPYISKHLPVDAMWAFQLDPNPEVHHAGVVTSPEFPSLLTSLEFQNHIHNRINYERLAIQEQAKLRIQIEKTIELLKQAVDT